jgi:hypothetical protein
MVVTPDCGLVQQPINVTIHFGTGYSYSRTYTFGVTITAPNIYIYPGPNVICSSESYTLANSPCGNPVTWSGYNSNVSISGVNANPVTITKINNTSFTLLGTVTACGTTYTASKLIYVGPSGSISNITSEFVETHCHVMGYKFTGVGTDRATTFDWQVDDGTGYVSFGGNNNYATYSGDGSCNPVTIKLTAYNACNSTPYPYFETSSDMCTPFDDPNCLRLLSSSELNNLSVYPNPASNTVTITLKTVKIPEATKKLNEIKSVIIYDRAGNIVMTQKFSAGKTTVRLNLSSLRKDIYTILVSDGKNTGHVRLSKL